MSEDPKRIGRYVVEQVLGRGAMGTVYRAHDPEIDRLVALKLVHADLLDSEEKEGFVERFRREARAAARCAHVNVVAVYDFALHEGDPYLAMEYIDGVTLAAQRRAGEAMAPAQAVGIVVQALAGLGAAHAGGITHRDIKPANIMLARSGVVKVMDFGISRIENSSLTADGMLVGTPNYMSPEQCRGDAVDARTDLYSMGVVLFELLAGSRPFAGSSAGALYVRLLQEDPPDLRERRPDVSPALAAAVSRALARERDHRFASAAAMAEALRQAVDGEAEDDRTALLPTRLAEGPAVLDEQMVATIERKLAVHLGPIAKVLVQSAVRRVSTPAELCAELASKIERPAERERFAQDVRASLSGGGSGAGSRPGAGSGSGSGSSSNSSSGGGLTLDAGMQSRLQSALASYVGPVARVLIKRSLPQAHSVDELWEALAHHIDRTEDRAAFLRKRA